MVFAHVEVVEPPGVAGARRLGDRRVAQSAEMAPTHTVADRSLYIDMGGSQECRSVRNNCILRIVQVRQVRSLIYCLPVQCFICF